MTTIEWTDRVWNPVTGCTKVSAGCKHCYAEGIANRRLPHGGFKDREFTEVRCHPERLSLPLSWRKPQRVFVNSMSDLFHEDVPTDFIDQVFAVMSLCPQHTFQVLTKRPDHMMVYLQDQWTGFRQRTAMMEIKPALSHHLEYPLRNVWLGVSVEDQATADERIPLLLQTPAALRFISYEPALGPVNFARWLDKPWCPTHDWAGGFCVQDCGDWRQLNLIIVGGESGPGARAFDVQWARSTVAQCKDAGVAVFVKQLGTRAVRRCNLCRGGGVRVLQCRMHGIGEIGHGDDGMLRMFLRDRKGGDMSEWPEDLRVRELPA